MRSDAIPGAIRLTVGSVETRLQFTRGRLDRSLGECIIPSVHPDRMMVNRPQLFDQMAVLGDALRSRILLVVERGELTVGELCRVVRAPQSTVSRSLKSLLDGGWVVSRAD